MPSVGNTRRCYPSRDGAQAGAGSMHLSLSTRTMALWQQPTQEHTEASLGIADRWHAHWTQVMQGGRRLRVPWSTGSSGVKRQREHVVCSPGKVTAKSAMPRLREIEHTWTRRRKRRRYTRTPWLTRRERIARTCPPLAKEGTTLPSASGETNTMQTARTT